MYYELGTCLTLVKDIKIWWESDRSESIMPSGDPWIITEVIDRRTDCDYRLMHMSGRKTIVCHGWTVDHFVLL